jgi:hypothetical protein
MHPLTDIGLKRFLDDWAKSGAQDLSACVPRRSRTRLSRG